MTGNALRCVLTFLMTTAIACDSVGPSTDAVSRFQVIQVDALVVGELNGPGDAHSYVLRGGSGKVRVRLDGDLTAGGTPVLIEVMDSASSALVASNAPGQVAAPAETGWFALSTTKTYLVRVSAPGAVGPQAYRFRVLPYQAWVAIGDTVNGEMLQTLNMWTDSYFLEGQVGQEIVIFLQATGGDAAQNNQLFLRSPTQDEHEWIGVTTSAGTDADLEANSTGRRLLPIDGVYEISVLGGGNPSADRHGVGPYRFFIYPVDRAPETAPARIEIGDTITEAIDHVADVDEFVFHGEEGTVVNVFFQAETGLTGGVTVQLLGAGELYHEFAVHERRPALEDYRTGRIALRATGDHRVLVAGSARGTPHLDTGQYRFEVSLVDRAPERVPAELAIGQVVDEEWFDRPGDIDAFVVSGLPGTEVLVLFEAPGLPDEHAIRVTAVESDTVIWTSLLGLPFEEGIRFALASADPHTLLVASADPMSGHTGPYSLQLFPLDRAPELVPAHIELGAVVTGETIEPRGEVDEFTFDGAAGQEVMVFARVLPGYEGSLQLHLAGSSRYLGVWEPCDELFACHTGNLLWVLPYAGLNTIIANADPGAQPVGSGPYEFVVFPIDREPENVSPAYVIGDTVRGEPIFPRGDIDEFHMDGVAGDRLGIHFTASTDDLTLAVVRVETGEVIIAAGANREEHEWGDFDLPATGSYLVRVSAGFHVPVEGEYEFSIYRRD